MSIVKQVIDILAFLPCVTTKLILQWQFLDIAKTYDIYRKRPNITRYNQFQMLLGSTLKCQCILLKNKCLY